MSYHIKTHYTGPGSLTPLAPISMQEMKLGTGSLLDHPSLQGKQCTQWWSV